MALVAGGAANSMIIFHAESVKVPVNCTLTSASELEAALPKELLPISALGKRIHHCRPRETAKSFPELPAAKPPRSPPLLSFLSLFFLPQKGKRGRLPDCFCSLWLWQKRVGGRFGGRCRLPLGLGLPTCPHSSWAAPRPLALALRRLHRRCAQGPSGEICGSAPSSLLGPLSLWSPPGADKRVGVQPPPVSLLLAPKLFHPPHWGGQGAPRSLAPCARGTPCLGLGRAADLCPLSAGWGPQLCT